MMRRINTTNTTTMDASQLLEQKRRAKEDDGDGDVGDGVFVGIDPGTASGKEEEEEPSRRVSIICWKMDCFKSVDP